MGVDFYLACAECKEFIDLHKWPVVESAGRQLVNAHYKRHEYESQRYFEDSPSPYQFSDLDTLFKKVLVTSQHIRDAIAAGPPDQEYIHTLIPIVQTFADTHIEHSIFLSCDMGDPDEAPWSPVQRNFAEWLELPTGAFHPSYHYLPRNLVDVLGLRTWDDVLERMKGEWAFDDGGWSSGEIKAIRAEFERRVSGAKTQTRDLQ